jgi:hypothetical protein
MRIRSATPTPNSSRGIGWPAVSAGSLFATILLLLLPVLVSAQEPAKTAFTADRHVARGLQCSGCHGDSANSPAGGDKCLACHQSIDAMATRTTDVLDPNPHDGHVGELECTLCHRGHAADELLCRNCHGKMVVKRKAAPAGSQGAAK